MREKLSSVLEILGDVAVLPLVWAWFLMLKNVAVISGHSKSVWEFPLGFVSETFKNSSDLFYI